MKSPSYNCIRPGGLSALPHTMGPPTYHGTTHVTPYEVSYDAGLTGTEYMTPTYKKGNMKA